MSLTLDMFLRVPGTRLVLRHDPETGDAIGVEDGSDAGRGVPLDPEIRRQEDERCKAQFLHTIERTFGAHVSACALARTREDNLWGRDVSLNDRTVQMIARQGGEQRAHLLRQTFAAMKNFLTPRREWGPEPFIERAGLEQLTPGHITFDVVFVYGRCQLGQWPELDHSDIKDRELIAMFQAEVGQDENFGRNPIPDETFVEHARTAITRFAETRRRDRLVEQTNADMTAFLTPQFTWEPNPSISRAELAGLSEEEVTFDVVFVYLRSNTLAGADLDFEDRNHPDLIRMFKDLVRQDARFGREPIPREAYTGYAARVIKLFNALLASRNRRGPAEAA